MSDTGPYALNDNGSAKDPKAFREALRADAQRMSALQVRDAYTFMTLVQNFLNYIQLHTSGLTNLNTNVGCRYHHQSTSDMYPCACAGRTTGGSDRPGGRRRGFAGAAERGICGKNRMRAVQGLENVPSCRQAAYLQHPAVLQAMSAHGHFWIYSACEPVRCQPSMYVCRRRRNGLSGPTSGLQSARLTLSAPPLPCPGGDILDPRESHTSVLLQLEPAERTL